MKIGINGYFLGLPNTGIETVLSAYLREWNAEKAHEFVIFCTKRPEIKLPENLRVVIINEPKLPSSLAKYFWEKKFLAKAVATENCAVLWSPYPNVTRVKIPHVMTVHDIIPWTDRRYARLRTRFYYREISKNLARVNTLHFVSESAKTEFEKKFPKNVTPKFVAKNAVSLPGCDSALVALGKPYLLYLGGYDPRKNVKLLVGTWAKFAGKFGVDLVLAGQPPRENRLANSPAFLVKNLPKSLQEMVHLTGKISDVEKFALYKKALGFVHLSSAEGFNLPLLEALSMGCPALVSDLPVHREVGGKACVYAPLNQIEQVEDLFKKFVQDGELRAGLKKECKAQVAKFSWRDSAQKLLEKIIKTK